MNAVSIKEAIGSAANAMAAGAAIKSISFPRESSLRTSLKNHIYKMILTTPLNNISF